MWRKDDVNGKTRVNRVHSMKKVALLLIIMALSLLFVSNVIAANGPQPRGTVNASKAVGQSTLNTATEGFSSDCATTSYAGPVAFYWPLPQTDASVLSVRFSPLNWDSLKTVSIGVYDPGDGSWGNDTIKIYIYDDAGGLPGTLLASKMLPPGSYSAWPTKTNVSFASLNLVFNNDFHVGVATSGSVGSGRYESLLSDSGMTDYVGRSSYFYQGQWYPISTGELPDYNFLIDVYCCHFPITYVGDISGYKYRDLDHDGVYDAGEPGIYNWRIEARLGSMAATPTYAYADPTGYYVFHNLPFGTYYVTETQQSDWAQTAPVSVFGKIKVNGQATFFGPNFMNDTTCICRHVDTCLAGTKDNFVGPEPSSPNPGLLAIMNQVDGGNGNGALPRFDTTANNHGFGHTFTRCGHWDSTCWVVSAKLNMHLKATGDVPSTDYLALGDFKAGGVGSIWGIYLKKLAPGGTWTLGEEMTVSLDLGAPPTSGNGPTNIIAALQDGDLDVFIQDDTEVDYLELIVTICCPNTICGGKFNDKNADGVQQTGTEPGLQYWDINLYQSGNQTPIKTTQTDANGKFDFLDILNVGPGTFAVSEVQKGDWSQTAPITGKFNVTLAQNQQVQLSYFGNTDTLCHQRYDTTLNAGVNDTFSVANGPEPAYQTTALAAALATCSLGPVTFFDVPVDNGCFGQSFVGNWNTPLCHVIGARLYGRLKATDYMSNTDAITFGNWQAGTAGIWGLSLNTVVNLPGTVTEVGTPNDNYWGYGDVMSINLDLANLPSYYGVTSVISLFQSGGFDVFIQDDTEVDYLRLVLTICCEKPYICGDVNNDGVVNISDVTFLLGFIFNGTPVPDILQSCDVDCSGTVNISDIVSLIGYIFNGAPVPCANCKSGSSADDGGAMLNRLAPQNATLGMSKGSESDKSLNAREINVMSEADIAGVQLAFKANSGNLRDVTVHTTDRSSGLQLFSGIVDGELRVGLVDMNGQNVIKAGDGQILSLEFKNDKTDVELSSAVMCDRNAKELNVEFERDTKTAALPSQFNLSQNYPNPFNPTTEISFALPKPCEVRVEIVNMLGQSVKTLTSGLRSAGFHTVMWDGTDERGNGVSSGVYFYRVVAGEFTTSKKMVLLK